MRRATLLLVAVVLGTGPAAAAGFDMRTGSFEGAWCGHTSRFDIESREGNTWVFHGRILIHSTGEYDPLWIEQYADNSLRVIRYLQGANRGLTQVVQTHPPRENFSGGVLLTVFEESYHGGFGCSGAMDFFDLAIP